MPKYKLSRPFFNGLKQYGRGEVVEFEEGKQPSSAQLFDGDVEPEPEEDDEPDTLSELGKRGTGTEPGVSKKK